MISQYSQELSFDDAITAIFAGETVEVKRDDLSTHPVWVPISGVTTVNELNQLKNNRFRQVTPTINIGGHIVPKPLTAPPEEGTEIYMVSLSSDNFYTFGYWKNNTFYQDMLKRGIVYTTEEEAVAHAKALITISEV